MLCAGYLDGRADACQVWPVVEGGDRDLLQLSPWSEYVGSMRQSLGGMLRLRDYGGGGQQVS